MVVADRLFSLHSEVGPQYGSDNESLYGLRVQAVMFIGSLAMQERKDKPRRPAPVQAITWAIPAFAGLLLTVTFLVMGRGVEIGLAALLFGALYFLMRYSHWRGDRPGL